MFSFIRFGMVMVFLQKRNPKRVPNDKIASLFGGITNCFLFESEDYSAGGNA